MAFIALFNLGLVFFDISYIPLRNFYLKEFRLIVQGLNYIPKSDFIEKYTPILLSAYREIPRSFLEQAPLLAQGYDYVKGIEPHPETEQYLQTVEILKQQVTKTGLESYQSQRILEDLRQQSLQIIQNNPFEVANKTGTLETIKERMREHLNSNSSERAFQRFWTAEYLTENGYEKELDFFETQIETLIDTNYLRGIDTETGEFINRFWLLDLPFAVLFAIEFAGRTYLIHRRHLGLRWIDGMLWRWYDVFLFLPIFRWLRVIPVTVRVDQSDLIELDSVKRQISQGFVASIAEDITEIVFVRLVNQVQGSLKRGELKKALSEANTRQYIDLNETNEVAELSKLFVQLVVYQVLPKVRPDVEAIVRHNVRKVLQTSPAFQGMRQIPGLERFENQLTEQFVSIFYQIVYDTIIGALEEDPEAEKLIEELGTNLTQVLTDEMQGKQTLDKMQTLLVDLLEEVKVNYVERLSEEDVEELLEQTRRLRQAGKG
ncbi:hypothetical protein PCC7418_2676 [Halothece sp. PCC 7418]|uniref:hypothetical protein n=1 Tax=Halothece sp. (strain PCC 7418) TaxID=65093 RepID=UPI0002A08219|nr:hypothetical protein [Halothece sp. PCC 7418]AFZ44814.1 hypothetical protein PCC7418_2676 [Halothece sp. PCC 7418]